MAEASRTVRTVTTEEETYTLTLSAAEYGYLRGLLGELTFQGNEHPSHVIFTALDGAKDAEPAPLKVGDKIRILKRMPFSDQRVGQVHTIESVGTDSFRAGGWLWDLADEGVRWERMTSPAEDTSTLYGVTYVMGAKYRDADGDVWTLGRVNGEERAAMGAAPTSAENRSLRSLLITYGPLTRVTE